MAGDKITAFQAVGNLAARVWSGPWWTRYSLALGLAVLASVARALAPVLVSDNAVLVAFYPVALLAAWLGGLGPGLLATAVCGLEGWYFWLPPRHSWRLQGVEDATGLLVFAGTGALMSAVIEALHRIRQRTEQSESRLHQMVADRAAQATERARLIDAERNARTAAEFANRAKDQFLAMLGHELRNPLSAIVTATHLMRRNAGAEAQGSSARFTEIIERQAGKLARLVDDMLDVGRIIIGKAHLEKTPVDFAEVVFESLSSLAAAGATGARSIAVDTDSVWIDADPVRIEQVVTNLFVNAVKYTPKGGSIRVSVKAEGSDAVLLVEDTGVGISAELLPRIFDALVQADTTLDRSAGGLGLGLALVRRLVELHGGTVAAASDGAGRGSRFTVRLPRVAEPPAAIAPARKTTPPRGPAHRILVIEDNYDVRSSLRELLESFGHHVYEASDGKTGLAVAAEVRPDVALVDIGLPIIDGYEVARRIRATPGGEDVKLVALTGYGLPEDRQKSREAGFDLHLVKPVEPDELAQALR